MISRFQVVSDASHTFHRSRGEAYEAALKQLVHSPLAVFRVEKYVSGQWVEIGKVASDAGAKCH